ncbi:hypothetical protein GCM10009650_12260 [Nesterenkonia jeotgali]
MQKCIRFFTVFASGTRRKIRLLPLGPNRATSASSGLAVGSMMKSSRARVHHVAWAKGSAASMQKLAMRETVLQRYLSD